MTQETLTLISTGCIVLSGVSLLFGWYWIRRRAILRHRNAMLTATSFAALFLVFYLIRWWTFGSQPFAGQGWWRTLYLLNLVIHILGATLLAPLAFRMIQLALVRRDFIAHRRLARVTLPLWLYVAASGWLTYFLLYRIDF
jgi:putative membrane protein